MRQKTQIDREEDNAKEKIATETEDETQSPRQIDWSRFLNIQNWVDR